LSPPYFWWSDKLKKAQVWFDTDLGFAATKDNLIRSRNISGDSQDYGGRFTFCFRDLRDFTIQVTTKSKLSITYPEELSYEVVLKRLKPYLVRADGSPAQRVERRSTAKKAFESKSRESRSDDAMEEAVVLVVRDWKKIGFRYPLPSEIADETGLSPEQSEEIARDTRDKTGWFRPNSAILDHAAERFGEVLVCAARLRDRHVKEDGTSVDFNYGDEGDIVEDAKRFLKEHSEMLPKLSEDGVELVRWPTEALKYLRNNYQPRDRLEPRLYRAY
jgi:hypothetical protein